MPCRYGLLFPLLAVLLLVGTPAHAPAYAQDAVTRQATESEPAGYREAIAAGIVEYQSESFAEAREQFRRAHLLYPNARTLRGLGLVEYELHNYPAAVRYLEQALTSRTKPLEGATRQELESVLSRARGYVGIVEVTVDPASARFTVDGQPTVLTKGEPLLLPVGDHVLEAGAPERLSERRALTVLGGEKHVVAFKLPHAEAPSTRESLAAAPIERPSPQPVYKRWWLWTGVAAVVAGAGVATYIALRKESSREVGTGTDNTPPGAASLYPYSLVQR